MAAWTHYAHWDRGKTYQEYRYYVQTHAENYKGKDQNCADLSLTLLIDFAAARGLPVTFLDNAGRIYPSKGVGPIVLTGGVKESLKNIALRWGDDNKERYLEVVYRRIGSDSLLHSNTVINPSGPESGDLMIKGDHTALVYFVRMPGTPHPRASDATIVPYPGDLQAETDIDLEYWREPPSNHDALLIDYLNHRGQKKPRAELMHQADPDKMRAMGFQFRKYGPWVLDNWIDWDGRGIPTHLTGPLFDFGFC